MCHLFSSIYIENDVLATCSAFKSYFMSSAHIGQISARIFINAGPFRFSAQKCREIKNSQGKEQTSLAKPGSCTNRLVMFIFQGLEMRKDQFRVLVMSKTGFRFEK